METEGGEVIRVGDEDIKENGEILAQAFSGGVAVQELDKIANKITVVREENEEKIRDVVYVGEAPAPSKIVFSTSCKPKGKERARDVSPSPAPKRKGHPQNGLVEIHVAFTRMLFVVYVVFTYSLHMLSRCICCRVAYATYYSYVTSLHIYPHLLYCIHIHHMCSR